MRGKSQLKEPMIIVPAESYERRGAAEVLPPPILGPAAMAGNRWRILR